MAVRPVMSVVPTTWYYAGVFDNWMVKMATSRRLNLVCTFRVGKRERWGWREGHLDRQSVVTWIGNTNQAHMFHMSQVRVEGRLNFLKD